MLGQLKRVSNTWFELALERAPMELQSTLQVYFLPLYLQFLCSWPWKKYLAVNKASAGNNSSELGASMAELFGKSIGPVNRQLRMC